jgi:ATP-dependent Clp protease ATP-binding subunit ClpC
MSKFTPRVQRTFHWAREEAQRLRSSTVSAEHLLLALLRLEEGGARMVMMALSTDRKQVREMLLRHLLLQNSQGVANSPIIPPDGQKATPIEISIDAKRVIFLAAAEAHAMGHDHIGTEHFLLALIHDDDTLAGKILRQNGLSYDSCCEEILSISESGQDDDELENDGTDDEDSIESALAAGETAANVLSAFGRNLTELAAKNALDPVVGRDDETQRCIQILCRRTKNNPLLIGDAGVGKTAIVEGLSQAIAAGNVPEILQKKIVYSLDLPRMVAGTKFRGQFEERLKSIMDEIQKSGEIILFIDEIHTIIGAGGGEGSMDASNILKPALSRGEIQCIGATTVDEYRKHIEKDSALERRFQAIMVNEPSDEDTMKILSGICQRYAEHHGVIYGESILKLAIKLAKRFIANRQFPDKAIDIIDEAGARARLRFLERPSHITSLKNRMEKCQSEKMKAIDGQNYEQAAHFRDLGKELADRLEKSITNWKKQRKETPQEVIEDDIVSVVSTWTKIPLHMIKKGEIDRLPQLECAFRDVIVGQEDVIATISTALFRSYAHLNDPRRPIGSFLLLGPTGVGKSLLARQLATFIFGKEEDLIRVDMSEYLEKHTVARIIGSPPGYVGHDEGGQLTEKVQRKPYSVVLFDEIEKAHPDTLQILLQVLEDGQLTDSRGRNVSFRNTIILMTSNVGAEYFQKNFTVGFHASKAFQSTFAATKDRVLEEMRHTFKPEFLNRIGNVLVFCPLDASALKKICKICIGQLNDRLADQHIRVHLDDDAIMWIIAKDTENKYGARELRGNFEKYVENSIAKEILANSFTPGKYSIECRGKELAITFVENQRKSSELRAEKNARLGKRGNRRLVSVGKVKSALESK